MQCVFAYIAVYMYRSIYIAHLGSYAKIFCAVAYVKPQVEHMLSNTQVNTMKRVYDNPMAYIKKRMPEEYGCSFNSLFLHMSE